jgi:predicted transcriptional regulator of viral defense system
LDCLQKFDYVHSSKHEVVPIEDVSEVLDVFKQMIDDIKDRLQKKWQARSIANTILQLLDYENGFVIRGKGTELLLKFLDILNHSIEKEKDQTMTRALAGCVNFLPFCGPFQEKTKTILETYAIRERENISYAKSPTPQTEEESIKLLKIILAFVKDPERVSNFAFWIRMLHENIFIQLYPFGYEENNSFSIV